MKPKLCYSITDLAFPIMLYQAGVDNFTVQYGLETTPNLSYSQACEKLGQAILHALSCDSKIDNSVE